VLDTMLSKWQEKNNGTEPYGISSTTGRRTFSWGTMSFGILRGRRSMSENSRADGLDLTEFNTDCPTTQLYWLSWPNLSLIQSLSTLTNSSPTNFMQISS
jgi:hypothetical protein